MNADKKGEVSLCSYPRSSAFICGSCTALLGFVLDRLEVALHDLLRLLADALLVDFVGLLAKRRLRDFGELGLALALDRLVLHERVGKDLAAGDVFGLADLHLGLVRRLGLVRAIARALAALVGAGGAGLTLPRLVLVLRITGDLSAVPHALLVVLALALAGLVAVETTGRLARRLRHCLLRRLDLLRVGLDRLHLLHLLSHLLHRLLHALLSAGLLAARLLTGLLARLLTRLLTGLLAWLLSRLLPRLLARLLTRLGGLLHRLRHLLRRLRHLLRLLLRVGHRL